MLKDTEVYEGVRASGIKKWQDAVALISQCQGKKTAYRHNSYVVWWNSFGKVACSFCEEFRVTCLVCPLYDGGPNKSQEWLCNNHWNKIYQIMPRFPGKFFDFLFWRKVVRVFEKEVPLLLEEIRNVKTYA